MGSTSLALFVGGRLDGKTLRVEDGRHYFETVPDEGSIYDLDLTAEVKNEPVPMVVYERSERLDDPGATEPTWIFRLVKRP